ncbi:hypothetical protein RWE15_09620 [Virgibacillus halophilus]|uniref:Uncharacterized protein n=1 Tax=Tigheibacillus halophilus TaxID=361280 RepID=A0ABU5C716_9BACI|nr:hypothetical protein [Virgibacillus halophilus]
MEKIITKLFKLIKDTTNLLGMEDRAQILMYELFGSLVGRVFTELDNVIVS